MKGSVRQRGSKWQYRFRGPERDASTGDYPWITKGGFGTQKEAWQACREAMRDADRGRVVKPSTRTVAQFFTEWFAAIEPSIDATTWQNWKDYATAYVVPRIGGERLQMLDDRRASQARPQRRDVCVLGGSSREGRDPHGSRGFRCMQHDNSRSPGGGAAVQVRALFRSRGHLAWRPKRCATSTR
jgi:hypothetical protein